MTSHRFFSSNRYSLWQFLTFTFTFMLMQESSIAVITNMSVMPSNFVRVGEQATIICDLEKPQAGHSLVLMIRKNSSKPSDFLSEGCSPYYPTLHSTSCEPQKDDFTTATRVKFTILSVTWADRDSWLCIYGHKYKSIALEVYEGAPVNPAQVTALDESGSVLRSVSYGGVFQGSGTRTNPYDLRPTGYRMNVTCSTGCGYPATAFQWFTSNDTRNLTLHAGENINISSNVYSCLKDDCNCKTDPPPTSAPQSTAIIGKKRSMENLTIDCVKMQLTGLNRLTCRAFGNQYGQNVLEKDLTRSFYFLCPGGQRPMTLNLAEMIAIGVGSFVGLMFLICGCVLVRKHCKNDYMNALHASHSYSHTLHV